MDLTIDPLGEFKINVCFFFVAQFGLRSMYELSLTTLIVDDQLCWGLWLWSLDKLPSSHCFFVEFLFLSRYVISSYTNQTKCDIFSHIQFSNWLMNYCGSSLELQIFCLWLLTPISFNFADQQKHFLDI